MLLNKIDSKINTFQVDKQSQQQAEESRFEEVYRKSILKSKQIQDKYKSGQEDKHEFSIRESPPQKATKTYPLRSRPSKEIESKKEESELSDTLARGTNLGELKKQQEVENPGPSYLKTQVEFKPRSKFSHTPTNHYSVYENYMSLNNKDEQDNTFNVEELNQSSPVKKSGPDEIDQQILRRNAKILESRNARMSPSRSSNQMSLTSNGSTKRQYDKNFFLNSKKSHDKYEMYNDSFGSPDMKRTKAAAKGADTRTASNCDNGNGWTNKHIIDNLVKQEAELESYMPPSRLEPVPTTFCQTQLSITHRSSPDMISYQYEEAGSPPKCKKARKKLYKSPTSKRELKEDTNPDYI